MTELPACSGDVLTGWVDLQTFVRSMILMRAAVEVAMSPAVAELAAAIDRFCERLPPGSAEEAGWELIHLRHQCDRLELEFSRQAAAFAGTDEYDRQGSVSPIDWIRHQCHMGGGAAADRVAVGRLASALPESVQATVDGEIGFAHLTLIARTAAAAGATAGLDDARLLDKAREFSVGRFQIFCEEARHAANADRYVAGEIDAVEARSLTIRQGQNGLVSLRGTLDQEGGAAVLSALKLLRAATASARIWNERSG